MPETNRNYQVNDYVPQNNQQSTGEILQNSHTRSLDNVRHQSEISKDDLEMDIMFNKLNKNANKRTSYLNVMYYLRDENNISEEGLLKMSEQDPFGIFLHYEKYKSKPYSKNILIKATEEIEKWNLNDKYLIVGEVMNHLHNENDDVRFMIISLFDANKLYKLVYLGRSEIFTSTYNTVTNRILGKLKQEGKDVYDLAKENNFKGVNIFLEAAFSYGRDKELFNTIKSKEKVFGLIDIMFDENNIKGDIGNYSAIIDIINNVNDKSLAVYMKNKAVENFNKGVNKNAWGIILRFYGKKHDKELYNSISEEYDLPEINGIKSNELFDKEGRNIQQYFFYNDEDGKSSFESFISSYNGKKGWKITDKGSFITVESEKVKGRNITIYANKPENDGTKSDKQNGFEAVKKDMNSIDPPLESIIVVHRGHSYHTYKTIEQITPIAKMVFLGSCGGFQNISKVLDRSNEAQIISTRGTGTKSVNDPLFKLINGQLLLGKDINWKEIWQKISPSMKHNKDFKEYVRPDQNLGVQFYKIYKALEAEG